MRIACSCLAVLFALLPIQAASATGRTRPPHAGGDPLGEPAGLEEVIVERETLTIDLRPLADDRAAEVKEVYRLRLPGPGRDVHIALPVSREFGTEVEVVLDGAPVVLPRPARLDKPDERWTLHTRTPGLDRDPGALPFNVITPDMIAFDLLAMQPGLHEMRITHRVRAAKWCGKAPAFYWQLALVRTPALKWKDFGRLNVEVLLPDDWHAASDPPLERDGSRMIGHFDAFPAKALTLTVQAPYHWPAGFPYWDMWPFIAVGGAIGSTFTGIAVGLYLGRRGRTASWGWLSSTLYGIVWVSLCLGCFALWGIRPGVPAGQEAWNHGPPFLGGVFSLLCFAVLTLAAGPCGMLWTQLCTRLAFGCVDLAPATRRPDLRTTEVLPPARGAESIPPVLPESQHDTAITGIASAVKKPEE